MLITFRFLLFFCLVLWAISGCSSRPAPPEQPVNTPSNLAALERLTHWKVKGKMAIRKQEEAVSATLAWEVNEQSFDFRLTNFLGVTLVDMQATPEQAVLEADGERYTHTDASELIYQITAWELPLTHMVEWVKGLPEQGDKAIFDANGLLSYLKPVCRQCVQWTIDYSDYAEVENIWLPHSITLKNTSMPNHFIKLRIDSWKLK